MAEPCPSKQLVKDFRPYERMKTSDSSPWQTEQLTSIKEWIAMEKIHGANFSFTVASTQLTDHNSISDTKSSKLDLTVYVARRGAYLREDERFFGVEKQTEFIEGEKKKARCVHSAVTQRMDKENVKSVTIFGELFGGYYPHPSVPPRRDVQRVQNEVLYCPEHKFCAFDIAISSTDDKTRKYLDYDLCMEVFKETGFFYAEPLTIGTLEMMTSYPLEFESTLPAKFGLPPLDKPNTAEGIVIKPLKDVVLEGKEGPARVIFKRKGESFKELKRMPCKNKKDQGVVATHAAPNGKQFELLRDEMLARVTIQRVANVTSKLGRPYFPQEVDPANQDDPQPSTKPDKRKVKGDVQWKDITKGLVKDVIEEVNSDHKELLTICKRDGKNFGKLMRELSEQCTQCVEEYRKTVE